MLNGGTIVNGADRRDPDPARPRAAGSLDANKDIVIDTTAPTVPRSCPRPLTGLVGHPTVTFSEAVTGVAAGNFSLTTTGVSGAPAATITGSGATRTVVFNTGSGDGTIRLDCRAPR